MKKTSKNILLFVSLFSVLYLLNTSFMIKNFLDYSKLFLTKLVPVSFPFFIFSSLLIHYRIIDYLPKKSPYLVIFLLSLISGFPSGAQYTKKLLEENQITEKEGNKILRFSHFPNLLFVLGPIQTVLQSFSLSLKLLISIILSNILIFLFTKKEKNTIHFQNEISSFSKALSQSIFSASKNILLIYGTSIFFYSVLVLFTKYINLPSHLYVLFCGLLDLTKGTFSTIMIPNNFLRAYYLLAFISLGSISIHTQIKSILEDTPLSYSSFLLGRIISTILSIVIFSILIMKDLIQ